MQVPQEAQAFLAHMEHQELQVRISGRSTLSGAACKQMPSLSLCLSPSRAVMLLPQQLTTCRWQKQAPPALTVLELASQGPKVIFSLSYMVT